MEARIVLSGQSGGVFADRALTASTLLCARFSGLPEHAGREVRIGVLGGAEKLTIESVPVHWPLVGACPLAASSELSTSRCLSTGGLALAALVPVHWRPCTGGHARFSGFDGHFRDGPPRRT